MNTTQITLSEPLIGHQLLERNMRKFLAVILALLVLPFLPQAEAQSNLLDVGVIDTLDDRLVHTSFSSSSTLLTVTNTGNISEHFWGSGELITQWSIELNATVNSATPDATGLQVAVAHTEGVYVVNTELRIVSRSINTSNSVDSVVWDTEGQLWLGYYGGERRAKEYDINGWTMTSTPSHNTAMTSMSIISEDRIVTGGRDNLVKVTTQSGVLETSLSDFSSYPSKIINDGNGNILVGCANGDLFRYDFSDWSMESTSISSSQTIISINIGENGEIFVGTQNGKLHIINATTFSEDYDFSSAGRVMMGVYGDSGELYVISAFSSSSKVRLFDLDSDGDGVTDSIDVFPSDSTQSEDTDGDGYGDDIDGNNPDAFPLDQSQWSDTDGDGYGDNLDGNQSDAFPNNPDQWSDTDGDGFGDNKDGQGGDRFPEEPTQWKDSDGDGFGDEVDGFNGDNCPSQNGFSTIDRRGCKDSDGDGYSDPDDDWTTANGADFAIYDDTQWIDTDGDGYGDNLQGNDPDTCPLEIGNSTNAYVPEIQDDGSLTVTYVVIEKYGCVDSDGDGFSDNGDDLPNDKRDYRDSDGDEVGFSLDYNDSNKLIQTKRDYCEIVLIDESEDCLGVRDSEYQKYVQKQVEDGEVVDSYYTWRDDSNSGDSQSSSSDGYLDKALEIAPILGIAFISTVGLILLVATLGKAKKRKELVKTYGVPFVPDDNSAETEALEGKAGLSAVGGIDSGKYWDDDVKPMTIDEGEDNISDGFGDIEIKSVNESEKSSGVMEESSSIEELAGVESGSNETHSAEVTSEVQEVVQEPIAPPLPAEGLPPGWTMEQWKWYGAQWLANQGK